MMSEFLGGYSTAKKGKPGWVEWMVEDALSLHPNYVNLLGWQNGDGRDFLHGRSDLVAHGMRTMGYRFVPTSVSYPATVTAGTPFKVTTEWVNRAVGRAMHATFDCGSCWPTRPARLSTIATPACSGATSGSRAKTIRWRAKRRFETCPRAATDLRASGR